jgi:hypothetical protein
MDDLVSTTALPVVTVGHQFSHEGNRWTVTAVKWWGPIVARSPWGVDYSLDAIDACGTGHLAAIAASLRASGVRLPGRTE